MTNSKTSPGAPSEKAALAGKLAGSRAERAVWVFCGDSITDGMTRTQGRRNYVELVAYRVREERGQVLHAFVNTAVRGAITADILGDLEYRVLRYQPNIFSLMIGMNDCVRLTQEQFRANLESIVGQVRQRCGAEVVLQTCNAIHPELHPERGAFPLFMKVLRQTAHDLGAFLVDHCAVWEETRVQRRAVFDSWMADRGHPNALGHWVLADRILRDLDLGAIEQTAPVPSVIETTRQDRRS